MPESPALQQDRAGCHSPEHPKRPYSVALGVDWHHLVYCRLRMSLGSKAERWWALAPLSFI